jgi:ribosomal protein S18 acetylase RimI-like enzyme
MLLGNLLKGTTVVYRRIGGRIVPITIRSGPRLGAIETVARRADIHVRIGGAHTVLDSMGRASRAALHGIGVSPEFRKQGIGTAIFAHALAYLKKHVPAVKFLHGNVVGASQISVRARFHTKFLNRGMGRVQPKYLSVPQAKLQTDKMFGTHSITRVR